MYVLDIRGWTKRGLRVGDGPKYEEGLSQLFGQRSGYEKWTRQGRLGSGVAGQRPCGTKKKNDARLRLREQI